MFLLFAPQDSRERCLSSEDKAEFSHTFRQPRVGNAESSLLTIQAILFGSDFLQVAFFDDDKTKTPYQPSTFESQSAT